MKLNNRLRLHALKTVVLFRICVFFATLAFLLIFKGGPARAQCPSGWTSDCYNTILDGCNVTICYCFKYDALSNEWKIEVQSITENGTPCGVWADQLLNDAEALIIRDNRFGATWDPCNWSHLFYNVTVSRSVCFKRTLILHAIPPFIPYDLYSLVRCQGEAKCFTVWAVCTDIFTGEVHVIFSGSAMEGSADCQPFNRGTFQNETCYAFPCPEQ